MNGSQNETYFGGKPLKILTINQIIRIALSIGEAYFSMKEEAEQIMKREQEAKETVQEYYPLMSWMMLLWILPVLGGLAGILLSIFISEIPIVARVILVAAGVGLTAIGFSGFLKQYHDRKERIDSVIGFKDTWEGIVGRAPIAFCDEAPGASLSSKNMVVEYCLVDTIDPGVWFPHNILVDRVFVRSIYTLATNRGGAFGDYFMPVTFVTLRDTGTISYKGRKLHGSCFGKYIEVEAPEVPLYTHPEDSSTKDKITIKDTVGLIAHELQHRVLTGIQPGLNEDQQHSIMGE